MSYKITPTLEQKSLKQGEIIISKTDLKGFITYCNRYFIELSGYKEEELLGKPHNIVRHPDMPKLIFALLWQRMHEKREIIAYVKNLSKDGAFYWVLASVTPSFDENGNVLGYHSMRLKPDEKVVAKIEIFYKKLLDKEREGGVKASKEYLEAILKKEGKNYDEFIASL